MGAPVDHKRMKPKAGAKPTAAEKRHMDRVAAMPCLVTGKRPVTLHHPTAYGDRIGRLLRSHSIVVPLIAEMHLIQHGPRLSVEALGHQRFCKIHGICLRTEGERLRAESVELGILPRTGELA
ncbi:hypothetical protein ACIPPQ_20365 [Sphingopyxis sp. LARHCG72]